MPMLCLYTWLISQPENDSACRSIDPRPELNVRGLASFTQDILNNSAGTHRCSYLCSPASLKLLSYSAGKDVTELVYISPRCVVSLPLLATVHL